MKKIVYLVLILITLQTNLFSEDSHVKLEKYYSALSSLNRKAGDREAALEIHEVAYSAYLSGDISTANQKWYEATMKDPSWEWGYYNLACTSTLLGSKDIAMKYVIIALDLSDGKMIHYMVNDSDLASLYSMIRSRTSEIIPQRYYDAVLKDITDALDSYQPYVRFGSDNRVLYFSRSSDYFSSTVGGPDDPPSEKSSGTAWVVFNLESCQRDDIFPVFYSWERWFPDNQKRIWASEDILKQSYINDLIFYYNIDFFPNESVSLKKIERNHVEYFTDKSTGVNFYSDYSGFYGELDSFKIKEDLGNKFCRIVHISGVFRKKDSPYYTVIVYGDHGNGDTNYSRTLCYSVKMENGKLEIIGKDNLVYQGGK